MKRTSNILGDGLVIGMIVVMLGGCAGTATMTQSPTAQPTVKPEVKTDTVPLNSEKQAAVPEQPFLSGKVIETMNSTGYTYIHLEKDGKKAWFAVPTVAVSVGQEIELRPGVQMGLFKSKTLNKSFDSIVFAPGLVEDPNATPQPVAKPATSTQDTVPPGHPSLDADPKAFEGKATKEQLRMAGITVISGKVLETMDAGGYTYILIASGDKNIWGAVPTTEVKVGQEIELLPGQTMTNFTSKSLNKTFDSLIFSTGAVPVTK